LLLIFGPPYKKNQKKERKRKYKKIEIFLKENKKYISEKNMPEHLGNY
jgi:hypothetical protein